MRNILPFLIFTFMSFSPKADGTQSIRLRGRVPASIKIDTREKSKKSPESISTNIDKTKYKSRKYKSKGREVLEISFH